VSEEEERFHPGDLVTYYEFATYYYGEGAVKYKGQGIVLEIVNMRWDKEEMDWIKNARWQPYDVTRYRVLCLKTGRRLVLGGKALLLISKANETPNLGE
tara:strand:+ start:334 stop:630 length:297 start_codon:yes stop_codon:yes gene_type:complete